MRRLLCNLFGHPWGAWVLVPETMTIVSECGRCPEVRSVRYEPLVPQSFIDQAMRDVLKRNPFREIARLAGQDVADLRRRAGFTDGND